MGIETYVVELGTSLVEIFSVGTAVRKLQGVGVQTASLPAQAIIRDKDTWLSGLGGTSTCNRRAPAAELAGRHGVVQYRP